MKDTQVIGVIIKPTARENISGLPEIDMKETGWIFLSMVWELTISLMVINIQVNIATGSLGAKAVTIGPLELSIMVTLKKVTNKVKVDGRRSK